MCLWEPWGLRGGSQPSSPPLPQRFQKSWGSPVKFVCVCVCIVFILSPLLICYSRIAPPPHPLQASQISLSHGFFFKRRSSDIGDADGHGPRLLEWGAYVSWSSHKEFMHCGDFICPSGEERLHSQAQCRYTGCSLDKLLLFRHVSLI